MVQMILARLVVVRRVSVTRATIFTHTGSYSNPFSAGFALLSRWPHHRGCATRQRSTPIVSLTNFFTGDGCDLKGRKLGDVLAMSDLQLDWTHDFIQTLFPLAERSEHEPNAPILTPADASLLRASPEARRRMLAALVRMSNFFGAPPFADPKHHGMPPYWALQSSNHNHKRITRMIKSLRLFGMEEEARDFYTGICAVADAVGPLSEDGGVTALTRTFWKDALEGPIGA